LIKAQKCKSKSDYNIKCKKASQMKSIEKRGSLTILKMGKNAQ